MKLNSNRGFSELHVIGLILFVLVAFICFLVYVEGEELRSSKFAVVSKVTPHINEDGNLKFNVNLTTQEDGTVEFVSSDESFVETEGKCVLAFNGFREDGVIPSWKENSYDFPSLKKNFGIIEDCLSLQVDVNEVDSLQDLAEKVNGITSKEQADQAENSAEVQALKVQLAELEALKAAKVKAAAENSEAARLRAQVKALKAEISREPQLVPPITVSGGEMNYGKCALERDLLSTKRRQQNFLHAQEMEDLMQRQAKQKQTLDKKEAQLDANCQ